MERKNKLLEKIKRLPSKPGIYMMKSKDNKIIYIGKAKNLKNRVSSYFQASHSYNEKTNTLVSLIDDIDIMITDNELEALILENNLIKRYKPRFNIELKENERYPYIKITKEKFPRITKTRIKKDDGSIYFGPYPGVRAINNTLKTITEIFPVRRCNRNLENRQDYQPCLNYYLGKCKSPCSGKISEEQYKELVNQVVLFLRGKKKSLITNLKNDMAEASRSLNFEYALELRDRLKAIETILREQKITYQGEKNSDIIGIESSGDFVHITILVRRNDRIIGKKDYDFDSMLSEKEILEQFLERYYLETDDIPQTIILPFLTENSDLIAKYISEKTEGEVEITIPRNKVESSLVGMANKNAMYRIREKQFEYNPEDSLSALKRILNLSKVPTIIEGFDVATLLGTLSVASMVTFKNGIPYKKGYRRFKIRYENGQNDVEMIKEAVARRYQRLLNENRELPDLILIDGGIPQVNGAKEILTKLNLDIPIVGLAKKEENIFVPERKEPIILPKNDSALRLLMAVRDEAHRFANAYHLRLREREKISSELEKIRGIGKKKAIQILSNIEKSSNSISIENLEKIPYIGKKFAPQVYNVLKTVLK